MRPEPLRKDTIQIPTALWAQVEFLLICMVLALMRIDIHKYVLPFPDENNTTADFHTSEFSSSLFNLLDIVSLSKSGSQRPSCWTQDGGGWTEQQHKMPQPPLSSLPPSARSRLEFLEASDSTTWLRLFFLLKAHTHRVSKICNKVLHAGHDTVYKEQHCNQRRPYSTQEGCYVPSLRNRELIVLPAMNLVRTWPRFQTACLNLAGRKKIK